MDMTTGKTVMFSNGSDVKLKLYVSMHNEQKYILDI